MTDATATVPRRGWWWLGFGVIAYMIAADMPVAQTLLPIHHALALLLPSLAACAVVGWWRGGSALRALGAVACAAWPIWSAARGGISSDTLSAGWSVLAAGSLGLSLVASRSTRFLGKGVVAVLSALIVSALLVVITPSGPAAFERTVDSVLEVRGNADLNNWRVARAQMTRGSTTRADSATTAVLDRFESSVSALPQLARMVLPSMLALQTLVAMALAWSLFHRFSRTRLGDDLVRLREFRFNDHWIWSVIVGLVLALLPALEALRPLGVNLLVFFGALYAMRGAAVLAWFLRPGRSLLGLVVGVALLLLLRDGAAIALGLVGLGDTWADWRRRIRPAVS
jgi:Predicted membrane protein (DUF2232)